MKNLHPIRLEGSWKFKSDDVETDDTRRERIQRDLGPLVGQWQVTGRTPESRVRGEESYAWLPGGFFLNYRWDRRVGEQRHEGTGIIGLDQASSGYSARFFDNQGFSRLYEVRAERGLISFYGERERATLLVNAAGIEIHWEHLREDGAWGPLCDLEGTLGEGIAGLARRYFAAYPRRDREFVEDLLTEDFTFTSPVDDHIDRPAYFRRCWPNSLELKSMDVIRVIAQGSEAYVTYEAETNEGERFRNTELLAFEGDRLKSVEVYFGLDRSKLT
jgi:ketosteroid isomerase-like protein